MLETQSYDDDYYDYWLDIEYLDDAYWDGSSAPRPSKQVHEETEQAGQKRKRGAGVGGRGDKKRKVSFLQRVSYEPDPILFSSRAQRLERFFRPPVLEARKVATVFLPNWRERYANDNGVFGSRGMPVEMLRAAAAEDEPEEEERMEQEGREGEWEDESEASGEDGGLGGLDPEMLKAILKQRLGEAGLEGMDESAFMATISQMLAGGSDDTDEAAAGLANSLLGQGQPTGALAGWLGRQGVSLADGDDAGEDGEDDVQENATPDSAVDLPAQQLQTELALHPSSPPSTTRKPPPGKKKAAKKVSFDVPPSSSDPDEVTAPPVPTAVAAEPFTSEDVLASETTIRASRGGFARPTAASKGRAAAAHVKKETTKAEQPAARATRKRKAADEAKEEEEGKELRAVSKKTKSAKSMGTSRK